nr:MAG TPA: hypothetical protein [Caudoviricetes sp.]
MTFQSRFDNVPVKIYKGMNIENIIIISFIFFFSIITHLF